MSAGNWRRPALAAAALALAATLTTAAAPAGASTAPPGPNSVQAFGSAAGVPGAGSTTALPGPVTGIAATPDGNGYWVTTAAGQVTAEGDAVNYGSLPGSLQLNSPILGIASTADGGGYWLVGGDGGIFSFGDATFYGSTGGMTLNKPVVGMAAFPKGGGYWLVASDGGIFSFGTAPFYGSTGGMALNKPVDGMAATPDGAGYWLVAADGGIFSFGDAPFFGSTGNLTLVKPVVAMAATTDGQGYWMVAADGGIFAFGDAGFAGSGVGGSLTAPAVGMAARPGGYWIAFGQTADWSTPLGQEQLLAGLNYLPLNWSPLGFQWKWANNPPQLTALWQTGQYNTILKGAIWAFQAVAGIPQNGQISSQEIGALLTAANSPASHQNPNGYTYSLAQEHKGRPTPETLTVWHTGAVIQTTNANTGIASTPTALGTYPVYIRYRNQIMTGTNPDGSPYADPVQYVSYFTQGDAIHYMPRGTYGYPQSLGCIEIPIGPAANIWQYTYLGSLVTVTAN
ncbi:MAG TPA: L,D-transpeptidase [Acidimicrobiales bacterium]|nr:L,D-transpeptidase [Acidimicrobiales bacterium]